MLRWSDFPGPSPVSTGSSLPSKIVVGEFPVNELLKLRFNGVLIEDAGEFAGAVDRQAASRRASSEQLYLQRRISGKTIAADSEAHCVNADRGARTVVVSPVFPFCCPDGSAFFSGASFFLSRHELVSVERNFSVYKFRTMRTDAEVEGAKWATKNDPRVTRVGMFMRKTRLDEVPQVMECTAWRHGICRASSGAA